MNVRTWSNQVVRRFNVTNEECMCKEKEMTHGLSFSNINLILYLLLEYRDTLTTPFRALLRSTLMNSRVYETVISLCDSKV